MLFGAVADAGFEPGRSDNDFLIEFESMPPIEHTQNYFGLLKALEALFRRRVDSVERSSVRDPFVLSLILRSRVPLYAAA